MKRISYIFDGNRVEWSLKGNRSYYTTNNDGEGIFIVYPDDNDRRQLAGTCDFWLSGTKAAKRAKIRRWMQD